MNAYKISNNSKIYIYYQKNFMLIITTGIESPLYYQNEIKKIINKNINSNDSKTVIFFDMLSCVKEKSQCFLQLDYYLDNQKFDYSSIKNVDISEIPKKFQNIISEFGNKLYCY